jgi:hypothetical protein
MIPMSAFKKTIVLIFSIVSINTHPRWLNHVLGSQYEQSKVKSYYIENYYIKFKKKLLY